MVGTCLRSGDPSLAFGSLWRWWLGWTVTVEGFDDINQLIDNLQEGITPVTNNEGGQVNQEPESNNPTVSIPDTPSEDNAIETENPVVGTPPISDVSDSEAFLSKASTSRFLSKTTFGPSLNDIEAQQGQGESKWLLDQFSKTPTNYSDLTHKYFAENEAYLDMQANEEAEGLPELEMTSTIAFWQNAITAEDQLRQRMVFALSQILVISVNQDGLIKRPFMVTHYQDILLKHAFGNYRDLLEEVAYSPAMGLYLTYLGNMKEGPTTGRVPDENFARELMQLFTIGLVELNLDGSEKKDSSGQFIETYTNKDITGLAKVFTGLSWQNAEEFGAEDSEDHESHHSSLRIYPSYHSTSEKKLFRINHTCKHLCQSKHYIGLRSFDGSSQCRSLYL